MSKSLPIFGVIEELSRAQSNAEVLPRVAELMTLTHTLMEQKQKAEEALARVKDWKAEAKKYLPRTEDTGVVTHVHKNPADKKEELHRFCDHCFSNQKIRRLQPTAEVKHTHDRQRGEGWLRTFECRECQSKLFFDFEPQPHRPASYNASGGGGGWMGT